MINVSPPVVELRDIRKEFSSVLANDAVSFDVRAGETHALVGENGAGKTTLMRVLYGQYSPDAGQIFIDGDAKQYDIAGAVELGIAMVHQNFMQIEEMSILENALMARTTTRLGFIEFKAARSQLQALLARFGMKHSPDAIVGKLSVGERQKVEIIKALFIGARILILDEPTAVLTPQETDELFRLIEELKAEGTAIVFISHKLREVQRVGDRISVMRHGRMIGSFARGETDEIGLARAMVGRQDVELLQNPDRHPGEGHPLAQAVGLWFIDGDGVPRIRDLSFDVHAGEILGVGGVEGNGQSELVELLLGVTRESAGTLNIRESDITNSSVQQRRDAGLALISEDRARWGLSLEASLSDNLVAGSEGKPRFSKLGVLRIGAIAELARDLLVRFDIRGVGRAKSIGGMSGGNLQKIVLAREVGSGPTLLVAAQPTRGLDIGAINFVREQLLALRAQGAAVLLITADLEELTSLSDRIVIMYEGSISGEVRDVPNATEERLGLLMGGITQTSDEAVAS